MSNQFVSLPVPAGNGVGAAVDVSALSDDKTFVVSGSSNYDGTVTVEVSDDGVTFTSFLQFTRPVDIITKECSVNFMRTKVSGYHHGTTACGVGAAQTGSISVAIPVPPGTGPGAAVDSSLMSEEKTFVCTQGPSGGSLTVEVSVDGSGWAPIGSFSAPGSFQKEVICSQIRVRKSGGGGGILFCVAANDAKTGGLVSGNNTPFTSPNVTRTVYARSTGDDVTGNGSLAKPYRTFQRAVLDVPLYIPGGIRYIVDITGIGVEVLPPNYSVPQIHSPDCIFDLDNADPVFFYKCPFHIRAYPEKTVLAPASAAVINAGDIASITSDPDTDLVTLTLTAPRASWGGDALKGKFLLCAGGSFENCVIASSTTTTLELTTSDVPTAPMQVSECSAAFETDSVEVFSGGMNVVGLDAIMIDGIHIYSPNNLVSIFIDEMSQPVFQLCELADGLDMEQPGNYGVYFVRSYVHDFYTFLYMDWIIRNSYMENAVYMEVGYNIGLQASILSNVPIFSSLFASYDGGTGDFTNFWGPGLIPSSLGEIALQSGEIRDLPKDAVTLRGNPFSGFRTRIKDNGGNAIAAYSGGGEAVLDGVVGAGNAGVGILASSGAYVSLNDATTVTGALGDVKVGGQAITPYVAAPWNVPDFAGAAATGSRLWKP